MPPSLDEIRSVPKVLLHDHLDGGLRAATVVDLARQIGYDKLPSDDVPEVTVWLQRLDARAVGNAAWRLGAGRARKEDPVSAAAGVLCLAKPGDWVEEEQPLLELRTDDESRFGAALAALGDAVEIGQEGPPDQPPIIDRIGN